jgi:hypothetical protein
MMIINIALILALLGVSIALAACVVERMVLVHRRDNGGAAALPLDRIVTAIALGGLLLFGAGVYIGWG